MKLLRPTSTYNTPSGSAPQRRTYITGASFPSNLPRQPLISWIIIAPVALPPSTNPTLCHQLIRTSRILTGWSSFSRRTRFRRRLQLRTGIMSRPYVHAFSKLSVSHMAALCIGPIRLRCPRMHRICEAGREGKYGAFREW